MLLLLMLLLSHFSRVQLCATPQTAAHQAPPSLGFSRQEHWSGLPFPSPMHESEKWKWSCSVVSDSLQPHDCSPPGSPVPGIFQARVLKWGAIAFSIRLPYKATKLRSSEQYMVLAQKQKYKQTEQDRKPRNKPTRPWVPYLWQRWQEYTMEKRQSLQ